ncbi:UNVERIFIED_CONTAM: hypothetical protein Scaly_3115500 [Sesamum calycinum]|uniref:Integrase catalytic domain-containing protein n=1 Tax=Sesamum calycinum TaxID=2727403 RepID=A0AAW2JJG4_9LAMI
MLLQLPCPLQNRVAPWPFSMWGMDGPISPNGHRFLIFAISYLTKWVEAVSYSSLTKKVMQKFLNKERICRYGLPERIITDNANAQNLNSARISLQAAEDPAS